MLNALETKRCRRRGNALCQLPEAEALGMGGMGRIQGRDAAVAVSQPGPDRIDPLQTPNMAMALQGVLLSSRGRPAGGHSSDRIDR